MKSGIINAFITAMVFVTLEPVSKLIAGNINPYAITFWRFLIGSFILMPFAIAKIKRDKLQISPRDVGIMALLGILFICISMIALQVSVKISDTPSIIAIIFSANSVFTILFAVLFGKEKMTRRKWYTVILCAIGVVICVDFKQNPNTESVLLALFAAISFSLYTALSQKYMTKLGSSVQTSIVFFLGSIVLLIVLLICRVDLVPEPNVYDISILLYLGILVTGLGYWSYFKAIEKGGAIMGSIAFFVKPILTPFATLVINGIVPDFKIFIAILFIVSGSYIAVYKKK